MASADVSIPGAALTVGIHFTQSSCLSPSRQFRCTYPHFFFLNTSAHRKSPREKILITSIILIYAMRNILGIQTLLVVLVGLICHSGAVDIDTIFTVHNGTDPGNCNGRSTLLDDWLSECSNSLYFAEQAMNVSEKDPRVQKSLSTFFKIGMNDREKDGTLTTSIITRMWAPFNYFIFISNAQD